MMCIMLVVSIATAMEIEDANPFLGANEATDQDLVMSMQYQTALLAADEGMFFHCFLGLS